jgi:hypothetical protein
MLKVAGMVGLQLFDWAYGAGSGNRTRPSTLGRSHSTNELYPHGADGRIRTADLCFTKALL